MSRLNLIDYILKPEDNEVTTMDDMNTALDDSSDFMRSDFFDSVMSLEEDNHNGNVLENNYLKMECVPPPSSETSSHFDEVQSNNSLSLDSDKWNEIFETSPTINLTEDTFFPFVEEPRTVLKTERPTQNQSQNKILLDKVKGKKLYVTKINPSKILHNKPGSREKQMIKIVDFKKNYTNKQVLRVQSLTGNGQPLLLPISDVKRIKIVNASEIKTEGLTIKKHQPVQFKKQKTETYSVSSSDCTEDDIDMSETSPYPALVLTTEEKRLLDKDGIQLPTHYPLTKNEERELKRIRRKIRNKISAQDSRKRKKEYVDGLEERVKRGSEENKFLLKRVKQLQKQNSRLMAQMSKLQSILFNTSASKVTPSTCLMIVLFSALLVSLPNLHTSNEKELGDIQQMAARRALLFSQQATNEEDTLNMEEFLLFNKEDDVDNYIEEGADENETSTEKEAFTKFISEAEKKFNNEPNRSELNSFDSFIELFSKFENKIKNLFGTLNSGYLANDKQEYGGTITKNGFMEPDIDDDLPKNNKNIKNDYLEEGTPPKRMKFNTLDPDINEKHDFNDNVVSATLNSAYKISESKKQ